MPSWGPPFPGEVVAQSASLTRNNPAEAPHEPKEQLVWLLSEDEAKRAQFGLLEELLLDPLRPSSKDRSH